MGALPTVAAATVLSVAAATTSTSASAEAAAVPRGDPTMRALQVADTLAILDRDPEGANQVLLGDFNAEGTAPELAPLWNRLNDAWAVAPTLLGASDHRAVSATVLLDQGSESSR
ncbi:exonuclease/endonuclease/phosphatase family protein [Terrabacter terrigena]|uniref:Endonuclease/exonuclease/phosphatase domain-containing protein n=1 Tax=Terrabacter terrigena TaxID=574718 RepID=A0ABW3MY06_9MICO